MKNIKNIVNFLFETGILAKTPRSGFHFLGSGKQSVAEHVNRTVYIGYALASLLEGADMAKVLKMCLFHDIEEARTTDLNYLHQKYTQAMPQKALQDLAVNLPFGQDLVRLKKEYEERKTLEARLAKDADTIEWILSLKEQLDIGNERAREWIEIAFKRLKTEVARQIAAEVMRTDSNDWWFSEKTDEWWVNRSKKD